MHTQDLKKEGDRSFKDRELDKAIACYTAAIMLRDTSPELLIDLHLNRSRCVCRAAAPRARVRSSLCVRDSRVCGRAGYTVLRKHDAALADADRCIELSPSTAEVCPPAPQARRPHRTCTHAECPGISQREHCVRGLHAVALHVHLCRRPCAVLGWSDL
jgi:hypothetical protein